MNDPLEQQDIAEIPRIDAPTREEFERLHRRPGRPVVMRVPGRSALSIDELRARFGALEVSALPTTGGHLRGDPVEGTAFGAVRLGEVIDAISAGRDPGWHVSTSVSELPSELARAFLPPLPYCAEAGFLRSRMWLAATGTVTPLHWDMPNNFLGPILGRRRILLYPPLHGLFLRPHAITSKMPNFARFDPERPDRRRFPLARLARPMRAVLGPGEVLYIPPRWWHHIRTLEPSLVVNDWWANGALSLAARASLRYKALRGAYRSEWSPSARASRRR